MLQLIEKYGVTNSHMVPTQFHRLLALPDDVKAQYDVSSLRHMVHAAAPCPPEIKRQMIEWWGPVIDEYYAASEGGGTIVFAEEWLKKPGTVGQAVADLGDRHPRRRRQRRAAGRDRHRLHVDADRQLRVLQGQGEDRGEPPRQVLHRRRHRLPRRGRLPVPPRPQVRHDHLGRRQHLPGRDRERAAHPPEGRRRRRVRHPARRLGRGGQGGHRARRRRRAATPSSPTRSSRSAPTSSRSSRRRESIDFIAEMPRDPNGKLYKRKLRDPYWEGRERAI